ncbi:hypothetical protein HK101_001102 [Irineochytrium annulatum]|nr:hypothetical protein HK101_001102 [Irineochytrium annulatum]
MGACIINTALYVFFALVRSFMTLDLAFHLFLVCVLKYAPHPSTFILYVLSSVIISLVVASASLAANAIKYDLIEGCWYSDSSVSWIFYYGPLMVPCLGSIIMAAAVRVSLMDHLQKMAHVASLATEKGTAEKKFLLLPTQSACGVSRAVSKSHEGDNFIPSDKHVEHQPATPVINKTQKEALKSLQKKFSRPFGTIDSDSLRSVAIPVTL